jgi:hypothetical protein
LTAFGGITDRLIPLFAVGAFLSFTLSQIGMAQHWRRMRQGPVDRLRLWINGTGALTTGAALVIILVAKFSEGAWLTIVVIPLTLLLLKSTRRYYRDLERQVLGGRRRALDLRDRAPPTIVIPLERWDRIAHRAIHVATRLSPDVVALHLSDLEGPDVVEHEMRLRLEWTRFVEQPAAAAGLSAPCLRLEPSPYRSVLAPLLREVQALLPRATHHRRAERAGWRTLVGGRAAHAPHPTPADAGATARWPRRVRAGDALAT